MSLMCKFFGHKYNYPKNNIQTCCRCGIARNVPRVCSHQWEVYAVEKRVLYSSYTHGNVYINRCVKCGSITKVS